MPPYTFGFLTSLIDIHFPGSTGPPGPSSRTTFNWQTYFPGGGPGALFLYTLNTGGPNPKVVFAEVTPIAAGVSVSYTGPFYGPNTPYKNVFQNAWLVSSPNGAIQVQGNDTSYVDMWYFMQPAPGTPVAYYLQIVGETFSKPPVISKVPDPAFSPIPWIAVGGPSPEGVVILAGVIPPLGTPPLNPNPARYPYMAYNIYGDALQWINLDGEVYPGHL